MFAGRKRAFKTLNTTSTFKEKKKQETDLKIFVTGNRKRTAIPVCVPREDFPWGPHPAGSPRHCQTGDVPPWQWLHHLLHQQCPTVTGYLPCWQEGLQEILRLQHWQGTPHRNSDLGPMCIWQIGALFSDIIRYQHLHFWGVLIEVLIITCKPYVYLGIYWYKIWAVINW